MVIVSVFHTLGRQGDIATDISALEDEIYGVDCNIYKKGDRNEVVFY